MDSKEVTSSGIDRRFSKQQDKGPKQKILAERKEEKKSLCTRGAWDYTKKGKKVTVLMEKTKDKKADGASRHH